MKYGFAGPNEVIESISDFRMAYDFLIMSGIYNLLIYLFIMFLFSVQITELLGISSDLPSYCSGPSPSMASADIKPDVHKLIHNLVLHIHENEPDIEKGILVFLPTYRSLVKQWNLLKSLSSYFKVHILHSSVDTEEALKAMKISRSHRKVSCKWLCLFGAALWLFIFMFREEVGRDGSGLDI